MKNPTGEGDRENARHEYEKNIKNEKKVNQNFQKILLRRLNHEHLRPPTSHPGATHGPPTGHPRATREPPRAGRTGRADGRGDGRTDVPPLTKKKSTPRKKKSTPRKIKSTPRTSWGRLALPGATSVAVIVKKNHQAMGNSQKPYVIIRKSLEKSILEFFWAPSWPPLEPKNSDFAWERYQKSTFSLFSFLTSAELDFSLILASLGPPKGSKNR